ncbi:MAG: two-component regulator propeller domain-containing protein [Verrucomicrobiota bacterium]
MAATFSAAQPAACAPESANPATEFRQRVWTREHGLPHDAVQAILQTRDGFLWVATRGGLARFDGRAFQIFDHATNPQFVSEDCTALGEGMDGSLWIGTKDGLLHWREGKFHRYTMADEDRAAKKLEKRPCNGAGTVVTSLKFSSIDGKPVLGHSRSVKKANSCYQNSSRSINPSIIDQHTWRL